MSIFEPWYAALVEDVRRRSQWSELRIPIAQLLNTELILTFGLDYAPGEKASELWACLGGFSFPSAGRVMATPGAPQACALLRLILPQVPGRSLWQRWLRDYQAIPVDLRLFDIDASQRLSLREPCAYEDQLQRIRDALSHPPMWKPAPIRPVDEPGRYQVFIEREAQELWIPRGIIHRGEGTPWPTPLPSPKPSPREALTVRLSDLKAEASWMDANAAEGSAAHGQDWTGRMNLELRAVCRGGLAEADELTLNGLLHLVGALGVGKSSLLIVLAVHLARSRRRVALVFGDVAAILRAHAVFEALRPADDRLKALPLMGRTTRRTHLNRLHQAQEREVSGDIDRAGHPAFRFLSTVCALDGLRADGNPGMPLGGEPCNAVYRPRRRSSTTRKDVGGSRDRRRDCPLIPHCPVHAGTQELSSVSILLLTPQSFLLSGPQAALVGEKIAWGAVLLRNVDVILVDEADSVQAQFDDAFAPYEVLVGPRGGWLDSNAQLVSQQMHGPGRPLVGESEFLDQWYKRFLSAQRAADSFHRMVRSEATSRSNANRAWLGGEHFTGDSLLTRVIEDLDDVGLPEVTLNALRSTVEQLWRDDTDLTPDTRVAWERAVSLEMDEARHDAAHEQMLACLGCLPGMPLPSLPRDLNERLRAAASHLLLALHITLLERAIRDLLAGWQEAEMHLRLDRGQGGLFFHMSDLLARLAADAPMGTTVGFQLHTPSATNHRDEEFRVFRIHGLGRSLLANLPDALATPLGIAGPHVVLTSGTSFAPGSWRYHLPVEPHMLLLPASPDPEVPAQPPRVLCYPCWVPDPSDSSRNLYISGKSIETERIASLCQMIRYLASPREGLRKESIFDEELTALDEHRRRILLVVGSYKEAAAVYRTLAGLRGSSRSHSPEVTLLVPDQYRERELYPELNEMENTLLRSELPLAGRQSARFLIAPLLAIERGHNILARTPDGRDVAAFGSVFFLVRPYPRPGDLHTAVQRLNAWALNRLNQLPESLSIGDSAFRFRVAALGRWRDLLRESRFEDDPDDNSALLWTQLVLVWQCVGRLLRGGVDARVHFVDAKWAKASSRLAPGNYDDERSSFIIGFQHVLRRALDDPEPARQQLAQALYGQFYEALVEMKGIYHEQIG